MSELYWADGTHKGELETIVCGASGSHLQKWQKKAIKKAMRQSTEIESLRAEVAQCRQDMARLAEELEDVKQVQFPRKCDAIKRLWEKKLAAVTEELKTARGTAEYWKAEHLAGDELIATLTNELERLKSFLACDSKPKAELLVKINTLSCELEESKSEADDWKSAAEAVENHLTKQLTTTKLEAFNQGIEAAANVDLYWLSEPNKASVKNIILGLKLK